MKTTEQITTGIMSANMNPDVLIKTRDAMAYHLKVESRAINPRDPTHPVIRRRIIVLRPIDYEKYFQCSTEDQIGYLKTMGLENVELVHDPCLNNKELNQQIEALRPQPTPEMIRKVEKLNEARELKRLKFA
jgi:hypothetical protein